MSKSFEHDAIMTPVDASDDAKKEKPDHGHSHDHAAGHEPSIVAIGTLTLGGATFAIDREGQVEAGQDIEFGVEHVGGTPGVKPTFAWLANPDGAEVSDPVGAEDHNQHWHFKLEPLMPVKKSRFVLKVGEEVGIIEYARGAKPANGGILAVFKDLGFLELKLHGDAGDLELFLYESAGKQTHWLKSTGKPVPFDVPKDTVVTLTFPSHENKQITLSVRNTDQNEDEDGTPNMRGDGTNYFIFPGESGQDPEWLVGETVTSWRGVVFASFEVAGKAYVSEPFVLVPHDAL